MKKAIQIGDTVKYTENILFSLGNSCRPAKGIVTSLQPLGHNFLAVIKWGNGNFPEKVLTSNLRKVA